MVPRRLGPLRDGPATGCGMRTNKIGAPQGGLPTNFEPDVCTVEMPSPPLLADSWETEG